MRKIVLFLFIAVGFVLNGYSQVTDVMAKAMARDMVMSNQQQIGLPAQQLANTDVSATYYVSTGNYTMVYLQQTYKNIPVFTKMLVLAFRDGKLLSKAGYLVENMDSLTGNASATPSVSVNRAAELALAEEKIYNKSAGQPVLSADGRLYDFGKLAGGSENTTAELLWFPVEKEKIESVKLVWQVVVSPPGTDDVWQIRIDAATGAVISKFNILVEDHFGSAKQTNRLQKNNYVEQRPANQTGFKRIEKFRPDHTTLVNTVNYKVIPYPAEAPSFIPATTVTNPWANAPGNATSLGWHNDGTVDYTISRGNNVWATEDTLAANQNTGTPASSSTTPDPLNFITPPNYNVEPSRDAAMQQFCITNLFYWNNIIHDLTYQYGFDEVSGNFQASNQGRGGLGNDHVMALAQSGAAGHIGNNANFLTPADGQRGRMRMYLFNAVGSTTLHVNAPPPIVGDYVALEGGFSVNNLLGNVGPVTGQVVYFDDSPGGTHFACSGAPSNSISGKIALIDRGNCNFTVKVAAAQAAGAIAVIVVNNVAGAPIVMGGTDNSITIPAVMISQSDGAIFAAQLANNLNVTLSGTVPQPRDGDLDNGVISHEFGHGVSNRFTGGPGNSSCLQNAEQGGEGWSDYIGLMFTTDWTVATVTDGALGRGVGTYVLGQPTNGAGIRNYKYSTNLAINPLTYADMGTGIIGTEAHNIGEIWCMALWEMTWGIIQQENSINTNFYNFSLGNTGGNSIAFKLVLEGMRLQPCSPGYIDARNAILQADRNLYGGRHQCAIWTAFAKRGMGYSASQGSSFSATDQTPAFDLPPAPAITAQPANTTVPAGSNANFSVTVTPPSNSNAVLYYNWQVSTDGGATWSNVVPAVTTSTLTLTAVTAGMNGNKYRCQVTLGCNTVNSNAATLTVSIPNGFTFNSTTPATATCPAPATMSVTQGTTSVGGFSNPITLSAISGVPGGTSITFGTNPVTPGNSSTVVLNNANTLTPGTYNITIQGTATGAPAQTAIVVYTITAGSGPTISVQPANQTVCAGSNATFSITAAGATSYQWQVSTDGGTTWNAIGGATTSSYTVTGATTAQNGNQYRCIATSLCGSTTSNAATLTVNTGAVITAQPADATICTGQNNNLCVTATGTGLTYQWQSATSCGGTFTNIAGATSNCYLAAPGTTTVYRCQVNSSTCPGVVNSNCATITVVTSVTVTGQPANQTVCEGSAASFTAAASGTGLSYQWQISTDGGTTWTNISAATNATYNIAVVTAAMNNNRYRCVISNGVCATPGISNAAILTVNTLPAISAHPQSATLCTGSNNTFSVTASGTGITYQWQISTDGGTTWTNIGGATTSSYTVSGATIGMNNNRYRCVVTGTCTPPATSASAVLTVVAPPAITTQPVAIEQCSGGNAAFSVTGSSTQTISYQWQISTDGGTTWSNISGANASSYTVSNTTTAMSNNRYRVLLSNAACTTPVASNNALLTVRALPTVGLTASPLTSLLPGKTTTLTATPSASTGGTLTVSWLYNTNPLAVSGNIYVVNVEKVGSYQVRIQESFGSGLVCSNQSPVVTIDAPASDKVFIFPSPNNGRYTVSYYNSGGTTKERKIVVYDSKGAQVYSKQFTVTGAYTLLSIDMLNATGGTYYVLVGDASGAKLADGKVEIQH